MDSAFELALKYCAKSLPVTGKCMSGECVVSMFPAKAFWLSSKNPHHLIGQGFWWICELRACNCIVVLEFIIVVVPFAWAKREGGQSGSLRSKDMESQNIDKWASALGQFKVVIRQHGNKKPETIPRGIAVAKGWARRVPLLVASILSSFCSQC